jgi:hypothetical protein
MLAVSNEATEKRALFFDAIFGETQGYLCLATIPPGKRELREEFFSWPKQKDLALDFVQRHAMTHNVYWCTTLLSDTKRVKEKCIDSQIVWADLDACDPKHLEEEPTFILETSPNRFQALWKLEAPTLSYDAEDISRRIAHKYNQYGADLSGWDLTQLLRVPFTLNHKYGGGNTFAGPLIKIVAVNGIQYTLAELREALPQVASYATADIPFPDASEMPEETADVLMEKYRKRLQPLAWHLFSEPPEKDWSGVLWQLEMFCIEAGMTREEVFVVSRDSACNKYKRDGIQESQLWKEVCRAYHKHEMHMNAIAPGLLEPLLSNEDKELIEGYESLVDEYMNWAKTIGDAAPQYHQAGAFTILSSVMAGPIRLPTSFGILLPNVWFMILADTTLTRKSTAMDLAMDLLAEVDSDALMATDGSIEGLFGALQFRTSRPSVFLRDEFSGLLEMMTKKDYYAGMAETLTKLYDGKYQKRILRSAVIEVKEPVLIILAGGIRDRILSLLQYEHVASGFLPRFIFITAESDLSRIRPLGPPTVTTLAGRQEIIEQLQELHSFYNRPQQVVIQGKTLEAPAKWDAELTNEAWLKYNEFESSMMKAALASKLPDLMTPMFDRLSKSGLKAAVLLAALRMEEKIVVTKRDLVKAFSYVEYWRSCGLEIVENIGRTSSERLLQNIMRALKKSAEGITRSQLMQTYHLDARAAENVLMTLEQRGLITRRKSGRTEWLYANVIPN